MNKINLKVGPFTFHPFDFTLDHDDVIIISVAGQRVGGEDVADGENNKLKELCGHCFVKKRFILFVVSPSFLHCFCH